MKKTHLSDGTQIYCLKSTEAIVLDSHIKGYFKNGIKLSEGNLVVDIGANIGVFGVRISQLFDNIEIHSFEPVPDIFNVLKKNALLSGNPNFKAYQQGIGSKDEQLSFSYYPNSPALSTFNPEMWENDLSKFQSAVKGSITTSHETIWWTRLIPNFYYTIYFMVLDKRQGRDKVFRDNIIKLHSK